MGLVQWQARTKQQPRELPSNTLKLCTHTVQHMFLTSVLLSVVVSPKFVTPWTLVIESVVSSHFLLRDNLLLTLCGRSAGWREKEEIEINL